MLSNSASISPPDRISLKQRVLNAAAWSIGGFGLKLVIRLGSNLLLTRLLVPEMFGIMAIANVIIGGLAMITDVGLKQCIVQNKRGHDPTFLNTAWVIQIVRGAILWLLALALSALLYLAAHKGFLPKDSVYADTRLPYVIAIASLALLISGFQSTKLFEASRILILGRVVTLELIVQLVGTLFMITWVLIDRSIWALVAGGVLSALVGVLLSFTWLPGLANRWEWDRSAFHEIIKFGKWIFISSILGFLVANGDRLLLAGMVTASVLGVYSIAFAIFASVEQLLTRITSEVSFSAFSEIVRERPATLKTNYYRVHVVIASFAYFCSGFLMLSGHALIALLYDRRYEDAGWMLDILSVALLAMPSHLAFASLLALGLPKISTQLIVFRMFTLFIFVPLGFHYFTLPGALWAIVVSYIAALPSAIYYRIKYGLFDLYKESLPLLAWFMGILLAKGFDVALRH